MPVSKPATSNSRVIAHLDMDCFYVQVEQRKQPQLRGLPTAVVQYNEWKGGGLIAVSYEARSHGVKRSMRGDEARNVCPQIQLIQVPVARGKADLSIYRNAGSEVISILARKGRCERASIDEVYLDLSEASEIMLAETPPESLENIDEEVLKSHILGIDETGDNLKENVRTWLQRSEANHHDKLLSCGAIIVAELRRQVLKETEFTCSAGIAHNKMLAKLASGLNKPAQQTIVPSAAVADFLGPWPINKMKQLGGKLGDSLQNDLGIKTVGELLQFSQLKLQERYGINTGTWLWNIARGISGEEVKGRILPMSHGSGKTFPGPRALRSAETVAHWLKQLCEELSERLLTDLDENKRIAHTLTLHVSAFKSGHSVTQKKFPSKSCPLRYGISNIQEDALRLFRTGLREYLEACGIQGVKDNCGWGVTGLSIAASKIISQPRGTCTIRKFFTSQQDVGPSSEVQNTVKDQMSDMALNENDITFGKEQTGKVAFNPTLYLTFGLSGRSPCGNGKAGFITSFFREQATSSPLSNQGTTDETPDVINQETEGCLVMDRDISPYKFPADEVDSSNSASMILAGETKNLKVKEKSSILKYLTRSEHSGSQLKHENSESFQEAYPSTSSGNFERGGVLHVEQQRAKRERWGYNVHEIDPTVVDELPPDIQKELWGWMQPLKQHISPKRKNITSYFSPTGSTG